MHKSLIAFAVATALCVPALALAQTAPAPAAAPAAAPEASPVTGNFTLASDYRFRGISQTKKLPAVQGGIDYAHTSGFYLGTWGSSISGEFFPGSSGLEWDMYGGYKTEIAKDLGLDVGYLYYYYPGAKYAGTSQKYDNQELYAGLSYAGVTGKISYALSDYFGYNATAGGTNGNSKGTLYYDLSYTTEIMPKLNLVAHVGYTDFKNYKDYSYTDYKLGVTYDLSGWALGAAVVGSSVKTAGEAFYTLGDKKLWKDGLVVTVGKTF